MIGGGFGMFLGVCFCLAGRGVILGWCVCVRCGSSLLVF